MRRLLVLAALFVPLPAHAVSIDWVPIGNPGNAPDTASNCLNSAPDCGSVAYSYYISKYEITNAQYAEFLNAKATSDPLGLYNANMGSDSTDGGITQSGSSGSYTYLVKAGFENKPVNYVSFYDALRFSNWLNNDQGSGDTETGAYTLLGGTAEPSNGMTVTRNPSATTFLTSENEWYKAAYNSPGGGYFAYPAGSDSPTVCTAPTATANSGNCNAAVGAVTDVGAYPDSASPYGTFDQGGNVWEWNEAEDSVSRRGIRGGNWNVPASSLAASFPYHGAPVGEGDYLGFRVASLVPEPDAGLSGLLVMTGVWLASRRRRRSN